jgi:hypothetical protein
MMRFYKPQADAHQFYCGIDLHARLLAICIVDFTPTARRGPQLRGPCPVHGSASATA